MSWLNICFCVYLNTLRHPALACNNMMKDKAVWEGKRYKQLTSPAWDKGEGHEIEEKRKYHATGRKEF